MPSEQDIIDAKVADALSLCITKTSAGNVVTTEDKQILIFPKDFFLLPAHHLSVRKWEYNYILMFSQKKNSGGVLEGGPVTLVLEVINSRQPATCPYR